MDVLIWSGAVVSLGGVVLLVYCILAAVRARRDAENDAALKARLQRLAAVNMGALAMLGALAISAVGLMMVVLGIVLG